MTIRQTDTTCPNCKAPIFHNSSEMWYECQCKAARSPQEYLDLRNPKPDMVNHPPHYATHPSGVECIEITRHLGFSAGNAVKYLWRAGQKGDLLEDLKKAEWYLKDLVEQWPTGQISLPNEAFPVFRLWYDIEKGVDPVRMQKADICAFTINCVPSAALELLQALIAEIEAQP